MRLAYIVTLLVRIVRRGWMLIQLPLFKACGENVLLAYGSLFSYENIELGSDVYIGPGARLMSEFSTIKIGNKVMLGPGVTIMAGDHRTDVVGSYMFDVKEKLPENDLDVVIEDDVWLGANVLILKGVTIGRGSIIGAGSVVVKSVPPYTVYVGSPAMKTWPRWDKEKIVKHELQLKHSQQIGRAG